MKVLITGKYETDYNRTLILLNGLRTLGIELIEFPFKKKNKKTFQRINELAKTVDLVYIPSFSHMSVWFVKRAIGDANVPIVFDPLISRYMTKVFDYKTVSKYSIRAAKNYYKDKISFNKADFLIADTYAHRDYFCDKFSINPEKISVVRVGADCNEFKPLKQEKKDYFKIGFYGKFNPMQGVPLIAEAAYLLRNNKDCKIEIIGKGFEWDIVQKYVKSKKLDNIVFTDLVPYNKLNKMINDFDVCLGIFGDYPKADIVIPNKIYHYAACKKTIITKNTRGINELFTDNENIILTDSSPEQIVEKILFVKENPQQAALIANKGYELISQHHNATKVAETLIEVFNKAIQN